MRQIVLTFLILLAVIALLIWLDAPRQSVDPAAFPPYPH